MVAAPPRPIATMPDNDYSIDIHYGNALKYLAQTYGSLKEVIHELVQNAIDADATHVHVKVNWRNRTVAVRDNGHGCDSDQFRNHMRNIAHSTKARGKLGQFGLGFISPMGKCENFTFTSCPQTKSEDYIEWIFDCDGILSSGDSPNIPSRRRKDLKFGGAIWWRSEVVMCKFTTDTMISSLTIDDLYQTIIDKYNIALKEKGSYVDITFVSQAGEISEKRARGSSYTGAPLDEFVHRHPDGRRTVFRMHRVRKNVQQNRRNINIHIGRTGDTFRVSFANLSRAIKMAKERVIDDKDLEVFASGYFEGDIVSDVLELAPQRETFALNDDFHLEFGAALQTWAHDIGAKYIKKIRTESREQRYQHLGLNVLQCIERMVKSDPVLQVLTDAMRAGKVGTIGEGHADPANRTIHGQSGINAISTQGGTFGKKDDVWPKRKRDRKNQRDNKAHSPNTVAGPQGKPRNLVKNDSVGLTFVYDELPGKEDLWTFEPTTGALTFNITHPDWVMCDTGDNDQLIQMLQREITVTTLRLVGMKDNPMISTLWLFARESIKFYVHNHSAQGGLFPKKRKERPAKTKS
jgi:hypothetical protein